MQITFKLYASLAEFLPSNAEKHSIKVEVSKNTTAYQLIDQFHVPREMAHLVLLNGIYLQPEERATRTFNEGDTLAIWPPVAGG